MNYVMKQKYMDMIAADKMLQAKIAIASDRGMEMPLKWVNLKQHDRLTILGVLKVVADYASIKDVMTLVELK